MKAIAEKQNIGRELKVTEWQLDDENMPTELMLVIAKARWHLHRERGKLDRRERKVFDLDILMEKVDRAIAITTELNTKGTKTTKNETSKTKEKKTREEKHA